MRVLLEFGYFCPLFLSLLRVLLEFRPYSGAGYFQGFAVLSVTINVLRNVLGIVPIALGLVSTVISWFLLQLGWD